MLCEPPESACARAMKGWEEAWRTGALLASVCLCLAQPNAPAPRKVSAALDCMEQSAEFIILCPN